MPLPAPSCPHCQQPLTRETWGLCECRPATWERLAEEERVTGRPPEVVALLRAVAQLAHTTPAVSPADPALDAEIGDLRRALGYT